MSRSIDGVPVTLRAGRPAPADLEARRNATRPPGEDAGPDVTIDDAWIGGVFCRTVSVDQPDATIVYLHGGGFRLAQAVTWTGFAGRLSRAAKARVVLVDYRLAPEYPFPAALLDATAVYDELTENSTSPVFVAGDSAGGNLAAAVTVAANNAGAPMPTGLVLLSAWTDLRTGSPTYDSRSATDRYFPPEQAASASEMYLQGFPSTDPLASPVFGVGPGFPTTLSFASTDEILLGDAMAFTQALADAGVSCQLRLIAEQPHAWTSTAPDTETTATTIEEIGRFVGQLTQESCTS